MGAVGELFSLQEPRECSCRGRNGGRLETPAGNPRLRCSKPGMCPQPAPLSRLQRGYLGPPEKQVSLLLLLRLLHLPLRRMPRYPRPCPPPGFPPRPRDAADRESPAGRGKRCWSHLPADLLPAPDRRLRPQPTCRSPRSRCPAHSGNRGSAEPAGEAVPGGDTRCGRHSSL